MMARSHSAGTAKTPRPRLPQAKRSGTLAGIGEDHLLATLLARLPPSVLTARNLIRGPGDDCAVIGAPRAAAWTLLKTDCVIEGIHFLPSADPRNIGWKALARPLSDIGAMGGRPLHALITLAIASDQKRSRVEAIYEGIGTCAARYGVTIAGGETARSPGPLFISVALTGEVPRTHCVTRAGGRPGDRLFVTGHLGGSLRRRKAGTGTGAHHLTFEPRIEQGQWLARHIGIRAMMDLSDGLATDLPRLAASSHCGFNFDPRAIPRTPGCSIKSALEDGEDYELLFALPHTEAERLRVLWPRKFPTLALTEIGRLTEPGDPHAATSPTYGYDHFA